MCLSILQLDRAPPSQIDLLAGGFRSILNSAVGVVLTAAMQGDRDNVHFCFARSSIGNPGFKIAPDTVSGEDGIVEVNEGMWCGTAIFGLKPALLLQDLIE